jgi:excisionase family DNA binding protein
MNQQPIPALSVRDIAKRMSVNDATVRLWINTGKLPAYKLPGSGAQSIIRVKPEAFEQFLKTYMATKVSA